MGGKSDVWMEERLEEHNSFDNMPFLVKKKGCLSFFFALDTYWKVYIKIHLYLFFFYKLPLFKKMFLFPN